jgi:hypothetical protein
VSAESLPLATRLWFAWVCFFRTLFDPGFAWRAWSAREVLPAPPREANPEAPRTPSADSALQLLALLQQGGRLIDFLEQDVASFSDADIGAAARAVHEGSRKALRSHVTLTPLRDEDEGASVTLEDGFDAEAVKLSGSVRGRGPYKGVLRHRGWRAKSIALPTTVKGHDVTVLFPAEVEL